MSNEEINILREFRYLSDADLMNEICNEISRYVILTKSEEEAIRILEKYGKKSYFDFNDWKKEKYFKLMICVKLMNLVIPNEWYNVSITDDDIIERIMEFRNDEIKWINEYCYLHDCGFYEDEVFEETENIDEKREFVPLPSDIEIDKTIMFYNDIIEKEFGNRKKLVK